MNEFFRRWRMVSDWLAAWLAFGCAVLCVVGGVHLWFQGGPAWIAVLFVFFGLALGSALASARVRRV